jgi:NADH:ubiquinone oxidoreductase subunit 2 (subunit N)
MGGFISEVFISKAGIDVGGWGIVATVMLVINSLLSMGYYVPAVNKMLLSSEISEKAKKAEPVPLSMSVPIVLMVILIILLGVFPILGLNVVEPAVKQMMAMVGG